MALTTLKGSISLTTHDPCGYLCSLRLDLLSLQISLDGGNCEEEVPKKPVGRLSVNCRPSVDRQVTDSLPTVNQQVTDRLRKKENCGKHEQLT